ncbi:MAG TPA: hypothetical protein VE691_09865 [Rubrobacter sp.]|nr:hypothetical protein [Rubrobacter sp.]
MGTVLEMWGIIGEIEMFDRFAGAFLGGAREGCRVSSCSARAKEGIVT